MKSLRLWALLAVLVPATFLMVASGCSRKLNSPTSASGPLTTSTPTNTRTNTPTHTHTNTWSPTNTWTGSPTNTNTFTPSPTHTATYTHTFTYTYTDTHTLVPGADTPTYTHTPTNTPTNTYTFTPSPTQTNTRTSTFTFTPTNTIPPADVLLIDNMLDGDGQLSMDLVGTAGDPGSWFTYSADGGCALIPTEGSSVTAVNVTDGPLGGADSVMQVTGAGCTQYGGGIGFNFLNNGTGPKLPYGVPTSITGVIFDMRMAPSTSVSSVRFGLASVATSADSGHFGADLVATTSWQSVTLYFSWLSQESWAAVQTLDLTQVYGMQWQINNGTGANIGLQLDNIRFTTLAAPPTYTPTPVDTQTLDNFTDEDGQINKGIGIAAGNTSGYWYSFAADGGCVLQPADGATATPTQVADGPSSGADWVMEVSGSGCTLNGGGIGFNFLDAGTGPKVAYSVPAAFTGVRFDIRLNSTGTVGSVRYGLSCYGTEPSVSGGGCAVSCSNHFGEDLTVTSAWQSVTIFFTYMSQASGWGTPATLDLTQVYGMQWQVNDATGAAIGIQLDNVSFVTDTPVAPPCPSLIDTMEDGDNLTNPGNVSCVRGGAWYCYADSVGSSTAPAPAWGTSNIFTGDGAHQWVTPSDGMTFIMSSLTSYEGNYSASVTGQVGYANGTTFVSGGVTLVAQYPYVGFGFDFVQSTGSKVAYDVSAFTGIQFYERMVDQGDGQANVRIKFSNAATAADSDDYGLQYLPPAPAIGWRQKQVPWASLAQEGWGTPGGGFDMKPYSVQWQFNSPQYRFNYSVDNVEFY